MVDTVLITGASQGIGKATALLLARKGYDIVLAARQIDRLEAVAEEIRAIGQKAYAISTDVRDPAQVHHLVQQALQQAGQIDVLINDAGVYLLGSVEACSLEDWQQIIHTNLMGYIYTINALLPYFLERKRGIIVNVGSIGGLIPLPYQVPYTTSKYAITGLTKSLQAELAPKGIHVCGIYPSFIRSDLMERAIFRGDTEQSAHDREQFVQQALKNPLLEKPEDVAQAIWQGIKHRKKDVLVGSANLTVAAYQTLPGLTKSLFRQVFGMQEKRSTPNTQN